MDKNSLWKWLVLAAMVFGSLALVYPPLDRRDEEGRIIRRGRIALGLDLAGGSSFVVEVDDSSLREELRRREGDIPEEELNRLLSRELRTAREVALEAIRNRVDALGIAEPQIFTQQDDRIVIQMPGIDAEMRDEARSTILSVAFLEFRLVHSMSDRWIERLRTDERAPRGFRWVPGTRFLVADHEVVPRAERDRVFREELRRFSPREGAEFMLEQDRHEDGSTVYRPYYIETAVQLTGEAVSSARVDMDHLGRPKISLELNRMGRRRFAQVTRDYAPRGERNRDSDEGRQLAIILDNTLYSAPVIQSEIPTGRAEITGQFSMTDARRLVNVLQTGRLPVPVRIAEERTVAPSLGRDAIRSSAWAAVYGAIAVILFMLFYYRVAGVVANLALFLVLLMLPLGMVVVSGFMGVLTRAGAAAGGAGTLPTLTLPGIAGIVLTLGMAVDANVLIFERIREEQKSGKRLLAAIPAGYDKAFSTILDSNTTTFMAALILFWQGSGPVRGYAVTLSAGIAISMFTAVVITRLFFELLAHKAGLTQLRMLEWIKETHFDFVGKKKIALAVSLLVLAVSWTVFAMRGSANFGVDFLGGASFTLEYRGSDAERVPEGDLRDALTRADVGDAAIQYQAALGADADGRQMLTVRVPFEDGDQARAVFGDMLPDTHYRLVQQDEVGPQVGDELKRRGTMALIWALIGIVLYISWRFEFSFAVAAIVALLHDALIAIGIFCLLGRQLSMPMIAAVLTIVGYSVNDTIVVFDRIREDLKLYKGKPYSQIANISINQTLSRTLLTSITTLLTVTSLLVFGGGAIFDFALMLLIGIVVGTYSSMFVATPMVLLWHPDKG